MTDESVWNSFSRHRALLLGHKVNKTEIYVVWLFSLLPMASMHCGTPSSLPNDYAILSLYANARAYPDTDEQAHDLHDQNELTDNQDDVNPNRRVIRRSSFPPPYSQPLRPKLSEPPFHSKSFIPVVDEYTPLLVPRIEEEDDASTDPVHPQSTTKVYRDEFRILFKYTLPILRYTYPSYTDPDLMRCMQHTLAGILPLNSLSYIHRSSFDRCTRGDHSWNYDRLRHWL